MHKLVPLALLVTALALAACGTNPAGAKWKRPASPEPEPTATAPVAPSPAPGVPGSPGAELIERSYAAFQAMPGYETEMHYMQKKGAEKAEGVYGIAGKQPRKLKILIKTGKNTGTKLYWEGGEKLKVRPSGFLSAVTLDLPITDSRFRSVRGYTLDQTDIVSMFTMLRDPQNRAELTAPGVVTVTGPKLMKGCVKMVTTFNTATQLPQRVELSDSREVVFRMELKNFRASRNVSLAI